MAAGEYITVNLFSVNWNRTIYVSEFTLTLYAVLSPIALILETVFFLVAQMSYSDDSSVMAVPMAFWWYQFNDVLITKKQKKNDQKQK